MTWRLWRTSSRLARKSTRGTAASARLSTTPSRSDKGDEGEEIFRQLLEADSDLTAVDEKKNTPLHYACGYGKTFAVRALLEKGCDITAQNGTGKTPIDLVKLEAKNPINEETDLIEKLTPA